jgi:zinc protease
MYVTDCPANALHIVLDLESDRMANFNLKNKDIFEKEKMAVFEERLMAVENPPLGIAEEYIMGALSPQHPYGREVIGLRHNILGYSCEAIMDHYKKWYKPNNAALIVIGDVNANEVFAQAEQYFGKIKSGEVPKRERVKNALTKDISHEITYYSDKVSSNKVALLYNNVPHHSTHSEKDIHAISIGLDALFAGVVFQFSRYFIDKKALASNLSCLFHESLDPRPLSISAALMPDVSIEKFMKEFFSKIKQVVEHGISEEEFNRAKQNRIKECVYDARDGHQKMRFVFANLALGHKLDDIEATVEYINSVTHDDVNRMLKSVFAEQPFATVKYLPKVNAKDKSE